MSNTALEKRLHQRCCFEREVEVWCQEEHHASRRGFRRPEKCRSRNISAGGMLIKTPRPLPVHSVVKLDFSMHEEHPVQVFAKVVWSSNADCGLKFVSFDGPMAIQ
jgi:hypothetical protein